MRKLEIDNASSAKSLELFSFYSERLESMEFDTINPFPSLRELHIMTTKRFKIKKCFEKLKIKQLWLFSKNLASSNLDIISKIKELEIFTLGINLKKIAPDAFKDFKHLKHLYIIPIGNSFDVEKINAIKKLLPNTNVVCNDVIKKKKRRK